MIERLSWKRLFLTFLTIIRLCEKSEKIPWEIPVKKSSLVKFLQIFQGLPVFIGKFFTLLLKRNPLFKNRKTQKMLKINNFLRITLRVVFSHSEFLCCHHVISLIFIYLHFIFFLSMFLVLILIRIYSLMNG